MILEIKIECDECGKPQFKTQRDAANNKHVFCEQCWIEHVSFSGNDGKPYGFYSERASTD